MTTRTRPGFLWAVALVAIGIGLLGSFNAGMSIATTAFHGAFMEQNLAFQERMAELSGDDPEIRMQLELQRRAQEVTEAATLRWGPLTIGHAALNLLASLGLLLGGTLVLLWHRHAIAVMVAVLALNAVVDCIGTPLVAVVQWQVLAEGSEAMEEGFSTLPPTAESRLLRRTVRITMLASAIGGTCLGALLLLAKLGFYLWALRTLRRPTTRALFDG